MPLPDPAHSALVNSSITWTHVLRVFVKYRNHMSTPRRHLVSGSDTDFGTPQCLFSLLGMFMCPSEFRSRYIPPCEDCLHRCRTSTVHSIMMCLTPVGDVKNKILGKRYILWFSWMYFNGLKGKELTNVTGLDRIELRDRLIGTIRRGWHACQRF